MPARKQRQRRGTSWNGGACSAEPETASHRYRFGQVMCISGFRRKPLALWDLGWRGKRVNRSQGEWLESHACTVVQVWDDRGLYLSAAGKEVDRFDQCFRVDWS